MIKSLSKTPKKWKGTIGSERQLRDFWFERELGASQIAKGQWLSLYQWRHHGTNPTVSGCNLPGRTGTVVPRDELARPPKCLEERVSTPWHTAPVVGEGPCGGSEVKLLRSGASLAAHRRLCSTFRDCVLAPSVY